jgi:opine dehydrogenase
MNIMPYLSSKVGPAAAEIDNYKRELHLAAWPAAGNQAALAMVRRVYPQMELCKNVIELNFRPGNPGVHAQVTIPRAAFFFERARAFHFYGEVSRCASRLMDAHDVERIRVAAAYDCETIPWPENCRRIYHYEGNSLHELHGSANDPHSHKWNHIEEIERLLVEDICYSFIPMEALARVAGLQVPVTTAMTDILAALTGTDYRAGGITLEALGLGGMDRDQIVHFATHGSI